MLRATRFAADLPSNGMDRRHRLRRLFSIRQLGIRRLASSGLVVLLVGLPGFAMWSALSSHTHGMTAGTAVQLSGAFEEARFQVATEESLERKYRLEPGPDIRARHRAAADAMVGALRRARDFAGVEERRRIDGILSTHQGYMLAIDHMFAAIDAGDTARANALDSGEVDPTFDTIGEQVFAAAAASRDRAMQQLGSLMTVQNRIVVATPIVFALGFLLVVFFWLVMRAFETKAQQAAARETAAALSNERRLRALIQNAGEVILICAPTGAITYQSPAAETAWGYMATGLLEQRCIDLIHPDEQPAARALWDQVVMTPGATSDIEVRVRDATGVWRYVELIVTNLLQEPAIGGLVVTTHDIDERKAFERQLTQQAFYDSLTGLPNRSLFRDRLGQALARTERWHDKVGLLFIDLDNFKLVNDSLGHHVGDELLVEAARRLRSCLRAEDTVARLGGDEFVVLVERLATEADIRPVVDSLTQHFAQPFELDGRDVVITASIGIALGDGSRDDADDLLRNADVAMYRAKTGGKGRSVLFDSTMHDDALARLETEADLRHALERGELRVHYQPIVYLRSGAIAEVEALVRWQHPTRGLVAPSDFIPIAEETGLILPIGLWVLQEACRQMAAWHAERPAGPPLIVGVNLSPRQFQMVDLVEQVEAALRQSGLPASCLKLEITEGVIMRDVEATIATLWRLKNLGLQLAVDDFGTGYSSLSYLKRLPLDVLKIDRSFVTGLGQNSEDKAIVQAILSLAESLHLTVTAEGIETSEQASALRGWSCDRGQGYYFAKPLDAASLWARLQAQDAELAKAA